MIPEETFVHGELYVVLTNSGGRKVCVPYATVSGALAPLAQPCAHTAGTTCPCGASLSRWCFHCKQERTEFFARSTEVEDTSAEEDSPDSSAEEASAAGTDAEEDGDTVTATPPEPPEDRVPSQGASATLPEPLKDDVPPQGASATPPEPLENDVPSQGASASGSGSGNGMAAPPSVSGHVGRELPHAGGKKKKKKKRKTPPQGEGAPAPPVSVVPSAGPDEGEPVEPAGASVEPDEREAAEVDSVRQWTIDNRGVVTGHVSEEDARASLLELAVNVAAVVRQYPDGCSEYSEDVLYNHLGRHFYLLEHFLRVQAGENGLDDGYLLEHFMLEQVGDDGLYHGGRRAVRRAV